MTCSSKPAKSTISMVRIMMLVPIKWAQTLKVFPPSLKKIVALIAQWTTKNEIKKIPVRAIQNFLVRDDLKIAEAISELILLGENKRQPTNTK